LAPVNQHLRKMAFRTGTDQQFESVALEIFSFQAENCQIYSDYIGALKIDTTKVKSLKQIPFLPINFFKSHQVVSNAAEPEIIFSSSGTTGENTSRHYVIDKSIYEESFLKGFELFYGNPAEYCILGLLPGYLERSGSSLIYMVKDLIERSKHPLSDFYLYDHDKLENALIALEDAGQKTILIGVSFALLDFFEKRKMQLKNTIIIETGGMKGRKKEMIREELHEILRERSSLGQIHSEYGMTELLSQAYSIGDGRFSCPPWMRLLFRDTTDPFSFVTEGKTGGINVIDLANINSCSFIATQDLGREITENRYEILGRFDNSDIRGCSLMV
jgi:hypothetical protein